MNEGDLKSQALASDKRTSNLPTFKDIGKSLSGQVGQSSAPGAPRHKCAVPGSPQPAARPASSQALLRCRAERALAPSPALHLPVRFAEGRGKLQPHRADRPVPADPSAVADKASGAADKAAGKVQEATPDLSQGVLDRATKSFDQISKEVWPASSSPAAAPA